MRREGAFSSVPQAIMDDKPQTIGFFTAFAVIVALATLLP